MSTEKLLHFETGTVPFCYIAAFLTEESHKKLLEFLPAKYPNIYAHHVTLHYKPTHSDLSRYQIGQKVMLKITAFAEDDKAQACVIETDIPSQNKHPHITLSTAEGIEPVYSNELLEAGNNLTALAEPFFVEAVIGISNGKKTVLSYPCEKYVEILLPTRPQPDTLVSLFLLGMFGEVWFPGIEGAKLTFDPNLPPGETAESLQKKGVLALDVGGGEFDHHAKIPKTNLSTVIAEALGVQDFPPLHKLLEYAQRDDMFGKGTVSADPLDRAFGLSGLLTALNKQYSKNPHKTTELVLPLIYAHYEEERKRTEEMPKEFEQKLKEGKAEIMNVRQRDKKLKVVIIESDNPSLPGYLRSQMGGRFDVVAQWLPSGHLNILTRPTKRVDLRSLVVLMRSEEMQQQNIISNLDAFGLAKTGRINELPMWYYDPATNSIQNGGIDPKDIPPTKIEKITFRKIVELGLSEALWNPMRR